MCNGGLDAQAEDNRRRRAYETTTPTALLYDVSIFESEYFSKGVSTLLEILGPYVRITLVRGVEVGFNPS